MYRNPGCQLRHPVLAILASMKLAGAYCRLMNRRKFSIPYLSDVFEVLRREEFSQSMHVNDEHDVQVLIVRRENPPPYAECSGGRISHEP
jgi:hypothetical protein